MIATFPTSERWERGILLASLTVVTLLAWLVLTLEHRGSLPHGLLGPHRAAVDAVTLAVAALLWMAMAVGMMLPPLVPWMLGFVRLSRLWGDAPILHTHLFVAGYLVAWGGFSVAAAGVQIGLAVGGAELLAPPAPRIGGAALLLAGVFQLTPFKCGALNHCRSPISFLLAQWEDGPVGAMRLGWRHGLHCLGCCWALMALSLALGAMNLLWMAGLTLAIGVEKLARDGHRWSLALGGALIAVGAWLLLAGRLPLV